MSDQLLKRIAQLSPERREQLLRRLNASLEQRQERQNPLLDGKAISARKPDDPCVLSFAQERFWFLHQLDEHSSQYTVSRAIHLTGPLQISLLQSSLQTLVQRHEILRTTFLTPEGSHEPLQQIAPALVASLPLCDLTTLPSSEQLSQAQQLAQAHALLPFALAQGPLARWLLIRLQGEQHLLVLSLHHSIADGWSLPLLLRDLSTFYTHLLFSPQQPTPLAPLPLQFADYAIWQRASFQGAVLEQHLAYWRKQLQDAPFDLKLPTDHPRSSTLSHRGALLTHVLPPALKERLIRFAREEDVTLFMLLFSVFAVLLGRWSGQEDLLVGTPVANRQREELETLIGCLTNTLVLRVRLGEAERFSQVLEQVRETTLQAYERQEVPFEKVVEALAPQRDLRHSPLFQVVFVFQNTAPQTLDIPDVQTEFLKLALDLAKFDLTLSVTETEQGLNLTMEYSSELFEMTTVQRLLESYQILLEGILSAKTMNWHLLPLLSTREREKLLVKWAHAEQSGRSDGSELLLHRLFEEQVKRTPQSIALVYRNQHVSYSELNQRANQLAFYLKKHVSVLEAPMGLCVERSPEMLIGVLAILKAGGYYVPLDPAYPQERLAVLMEDVNIVVLLTQHHLLSTLPALATIEVPTICLDTDKEAIALENTTNPTSNIRADNLLCSIYTSGSTGHPKGVLVPHRGVSNAIRYTLDQCIPQPGQHIMQLASLSFDLSVLEIFTSLSGGDCLYIVPPELVGSGEGLAQFIREQEIVLLITTPSLLEVIPYGSYPGLRSIIFGGEGCPEEVANLWLQRYQLFNIYGPTEISVYMTLEKLHGSYQSPLPLGRPIRSTSLYVLDSYMQPVPIGVGGEIYVGGVGVTRGYHRRPTITAERFVPDPFAKEPGARLYRTGDMACYLPNGDLWFLGRNDRQVKVRGLRIELGEIEAVLTRHPRVQHAIVVLEGVGARDKQLLACYVSSEGPELTHELRQFLAQSLPSSLVPNRFLSFPSFPLNANGKIDRRGVQRMLAERRDIYEAKVEYQAPCNSVEERLETIWQELLECGPIGTADNFFQNGGNSLLATQIMSRVREAFQIDLPLRTIFEVPTIAELAEKIIQHELAQADAQILAALLQQLQN